MSASIPVKRLDLPTTKVETTPENAKKKILAWNADFSVEGLDTLTHEKLMDEFTQEYHLHKSNMRRAPIRHVSENDVVYQPHIAHVIVMDGDKQKFMLAEQFAAIVRQRKAAGQPDFDKPVIMAVGGGGKVLLPK